jgi:hypothetical protein
VSTDNAIYKFTEIVFSAWNKNVYVAGVFCDLTNTFYCVNHELLLHNYRVME